MATHGKAPHRIARQHKAAQSRERRATYCSAMQWSEKQSHGSPGSHCIAQQNYAVASKATPGHQRLEPNRMASDGNARTAVLCLAWKRNATQRQDCDALTCTAINCTD